MLGSRIATMISVAVVVPVACGGDDSSDVSKKEFIANADAVCKETNQKIEALVSDLSEDTTAEEAAQLTVDSAIPLFRDQIEQLRDLDPPAADADDIEQLWHDLDASTDELEQQLKDDPEVAFSDDFDPFADENQTATAYGFQECGA